MSEKELSEKVLIHLYNSAVAGSARSISMVLGLKGLPIAKNPRFKDLQSLAELSGDDRQLFFAGVIAVAEFAVYRVLDFIEMYHTFDSENNKEQFPHLSLNYTDRSSDGIRNVTLSKFDSQELGMLFKQIARSDEMRSLAESTINQLAMSKIDRDTPTA